jgi:hypothetical protein
MNSSRRSVLLAGLALAGLPWGCAPSRAAPDLAALLVSTPRERLLERLSERLGAGLAPAELLAAMHGVALRELVARELFSKEHHALLCLHPALQVSERLSGARRTWPLLWAADYLAWARERAGEPLQPLAPDELPAAPQAREALARALEASDGPAAERAAAAMSRAGQREALVALLLRYASRDFRDIGHKVIQVASGLAVLRATGWAHAEEAARSMALTLSLRAAEEGHDPDATWLANQARAEPSWGTGTSREEAVPELLAAFRQASPDQAAQEALSWLQRGLSPQSVWDAVHLSAAELMFNHATGVEALHSVTASHAARTTWEASPSESDRRLILLQSVSRIVDFRVYVEHWAAVRQRPALSSLRLDTLAPLPPPPEPLEALLAQLGAPTAEARQQTASETLGWVGGSRERGQLLLDRVLEELPMRAGLDTHDYKLAVAVREDHGRISPGWRARYLAGCTARLCGSGRSRGELAERLEK